MASLKSRLARYLHKVALDTGLSSWRARQQKVRRIVMLHGIGPEEDLTAEELGQAIEWLSSRFRIVPLGELISGIVEGRPPQGELALTFDDGLRCHLEQAYPVLVRHNAPATFFICPGLMEARRWLWNHEARTRLKRLAPAALSTLAADVKAPGSDVEQIIRWMKSLETPRREAVETAIRQATPDFVPTAAESARFDPLTWDDLGRLDERLVTIGSHTMMHPILPTLDDATLDHELRESRAVLERRLGRKVDLFCYPNGSNDQRVRAAAAKVYGAAVTTEYGNVAVGPVSLIGLPRIPVTERLPLLAWRMHRPLA